MDDSRIRSKTALFSFENGLVWTGPQSRNAEKDTSDRNLRRANGPDDLQDQSFRESCDMDPHSVSPIQRGHFRISLPQRKSWCSSFHK